MAAASAWRRMSLEYPGGQGSARDRDVLEAELALAGVGGGVAQRDLVEIQGPGEAKALLVEQRQDVVGAEAQRLAQVVDVAPGPVILLPDVGPLGDPLAEEVEGQDRARLHAGRDPAGGGADRGLG